MNLSGEGLGSESSGEPGRVCGQGGKKRSVKRAAFSASVCSSEVTCPSSPFLKRVGMHARDLSDRGFFVYLLAIHTSLSLASSIQPFQCSALALWRAEMYVFLAQFEAHLLSSQLAVNLAWNSSLLLCM